LIELFKSLVTDMMRSFAAFDAHKVYGLGEFYHSDFKANI
jgi:hypothetical protein